MIFCSCKNFYFWLKFGLWPIFGNMVEWYFFNRAREKLVLDIHIESLNWELLFNEKWNQGSSKINLEKILLMAIWMYNVQFLLMDHKLDLNQVFFTYSYKDKIQVFSPKTRGFWCNTVFSVHQNVHFLSNTIWYTLLDIHYLIYTIHLVKKANLDIHWFFIG